MDMMKMMKKATAMQKDMKKTQKALAKQVVEFSSKDDAVKVTATCDMKIKTIEISPDIVNPAEIKKLEIAVLDAVKGAINLAQSATEKEMKSLTAGMKLPF